MPLPTIGRSLEIDEEVAFCAKLKASAALCFDVANKCCGSDFLGYPILPGERLLHEEDVHSKVIEFSASTASFLVARCVFLRESLQRPHFPNTCSPGSTVS